MPPLTIPQLSKLAVTFRLKPSPRSLQDTKAFLKTIEQFGPVTSFKALRYPHALSLFTPTTHTLFASPNAADAARQVGKITFQSPVDGKTIQATVADDGWDGNEHEDYLKRVTGVVTTETFLQRETARASGRGWHLVKAREVRRGMGMDTGMDTGIRGRE